MGPLRHERRAAGRVRGIGGTLYTREDIDAALAGAGTFTHVDPVGHGTMTAAIGAGSGDDGQLVGMAPDASIVVVPVFGLDGVGACDNFNGLGSAETSIIAKAARFIAATAEGRPFVANMSLGVAGGPHDGTSLQDGELEAIATAGPGRALVVAAGNDGGGGVHAGTYLPASGEPWAFETTIGAQTPGAYELWYPGDAEIEIRVPTGRDLRRRRPDRQRAGRGRLLRRQLA